MFNALFCYGFIFKFCNFEISLKIFNNKRRSWKILDLLFCNLHKIFFEIFSEKRRKQKKLSKKFTKIEKLFCQKIFWHFKNFISRNVTEIWCNFKWKINSLFCQKSQKQKWWIFFSFFKKHFLVKKISNKTIKYNKLNYKL